MSTHVRDPLQTLRVWLAPVTVRSKPRPYLLVAALGTLAYFGAAELGLVLASLHQNVSPIWPASGLALALLYLAGVRTWPAVFVGAFLVNALTGVPLLVCLAIAIGNTGEALLACLLLTKISARRSEQFQFARTGGYFAAAAFASVLSASIGVASLYLSGAVNQSIAPMIWLTWWMGDGLGILVVAPVLIGLVLAEYRDLNFWRIGRGLALAVASGLVIWLSDISPGSNVAIFLLLPIVLLAQRWMGHLVASCFTLAIAFATILCTLFGSGPFQDVSLNQNLIALGIFLSTMVFASMAFGDLPADLKRGPIVIALIGCVLGAGVFAKMESDRTKADQLHFDRLIDAATASLRERVAVYTNALRGGASLFAASVTVSSTEWRAYVRSLDLPNQFPGSNGMGVIVAVKPENLEQFVLESRVGATPNFTISRYPGSNLFPGPQQEHYIIRYIEPLEDNITALGLDISTESTRLAAAEESRRTGEPVLSARVTLVQAAEIGPTYLLFLPMFAEVGGRRQGAFRGWVYTPLVVQRFFSEALRGLMGEISVEIYESSKPGDLRLAYESAPGGPDPLNGDVATKTTRLSLHGGQFVMRWQRTASFAAVGGSLSTAFGASIIVIGTLLAVLVANLQSFGKRATAHAEHMTKELADTNARLSLVLAGSRDGIWFWDTDKDEVWFSRRFKEILGYEDDDGFPGKIEHLMDVMIPDERTRAHRQFTELRAGHIDSFDTVRRYRHKAGHEVVLHGRVISEKDASGAVIRIAGAASDITPIVKAEQDLKAAIDVMHSGFGMFDADDRLVIHNKGFVDESMRIAFGDPTGHTFEEILRVWCAAPNRPADAVDDPEAWIADRLAQHRNPSEEPQEIGTSDGTWYRVSERRTPQGGYVGVWTDVTDIKRAEQLLSNAVASLSDGFALYDAGDRLIRCNAKYRPVCFLGGEEVCLGATFETLMRRYVESDAAPPEVADDPEGWVQERLAEHRAATGLPSEQRQGRTWLRIVTQSTVDGGRAVVISDISEIKRMEQRLKDAVDAMDDGFGIFDEEDRVLLYNEAFIDEGTRKIFGDPLGHKFEDIVRAFAYHDMPLTDPNFDREAWIADRMEKHRNPPATPIEVEWGGGRCMRISERRTAEGGYVGTWTDISALKRAEQRLQDAINSLGVAFALFDAEDRLVICNSGFLTDGLRQKFGDAKGRTFEEILRYFAYEDEDSRLDPSVDREAWLKWRLELHRNPQAEPFDFLGSDGSWMRVSERRTAEGGYVGTWTDITPVKRAERQLHDAIESINEGFALFDSEMRYVVFNSRLLEMYPISAPMVKVGGSFKDVLRYGAEHGEYPEITSPEKVDAFVDLWMSRLTSGESYIGEGQFADGRWALVSHHPTSDGGYVTVRADITTQINREMELRDTKARLEAQATKLVALSKDLDAARLAAESANFGKSQFLANMSHELRTPLNAILGFSDIMKREMFGPIDNSTYKDYVGLINHSGAHLLSLINDLLDLSKIEAGKMELQIAALAADDLISNTKSMMQKMAADRGVTLEMASAGEPAVVHGDERALRQILFNLLSNAIKFTNEGGVVGLKIECNGKEGSRLVVSDTGIGMTPDEIERAMQPYGQIGSELASKSHGTGLGLPLVKSLVELHGGQLQITSERGVGTTISVTIPWRPDLSSATRVLDAARSAVQIIDRASDQDNVSDDLPETVDTTPLALIVDDNPMNRQLLQALLSSLSFNVESVADGLSAIEKVSQNDYDLVLMDVWMPGLGGLDATRRIRSMGGRAAEIPIIGLTADTEPELRETCMTAGMNEVLAKPIDPKRFGETVAALSK